MAVTGYKRGVIGVLKAAGRVLMVKRAPGIPLGGYWCFPGGHLEPGETSHGALTREMNEELGIDCVADEHLGAIEVQGGYVLEVFTVSCGDARPSLRPLAAEIADIRWVAMDGIASVSPGLASNVQVARMLVESGVHTTTTPANQRKALQ